MRSIAVVLLAGLGALALASLGRGAAEAQDASRRNQAAGQPGPQSPAGPLRHVVLFKFKADATPEQIKAVEAGFAELPKKIDTIQAYEWGTDVSPEMRSQGFTHCFLVTFRNAQGRDAYLPHAAHQEFVKLVLPILDDVLVVDYQARRPVPAVAPTDAISVTVHGRLNSQVVAIGGETTGATISARGATWELDFGDNEQMRRRARRLHGRTVRVAGQLEVRKGVEIPQRTIVKVQSLQPVPEPDESRQPQRPPASR
ncbi:MAG TPA: Dabb family protein [Planctomycetaceae bacterium]|nr:Dabb family protein [Planctomycetaceae bacterium]